DGELITRVCEVELGQVERVIIVIDNQSVESRAAIDLQPPVELVVQVKSVVAVTAADEVSRQGTCLVAVTCAASGMILSEMCVSLVADEDRVVPRIALDDVRRECILSARCF